MRRVRADALSAIDAASERLEQALAKQRLRDTIAKLRAKNRDLKARLKKVATWDAQSSVTWAEVQPALDLKNKNWRKR